MRLATADQGSMRSVESYVFRIASNILADRGRREKVRANYRESIWANDAAGIDVLDPGRVAEARAELSAVAEALKSLPERTRTIFILYRLENLDKRSIAEALGVSVSAVDKHLMRAHAHLVLTIRSAQ